MAILNLVYLPDARLREKSKPVTSFDPALKKLVSDMAETMIWAKGIGLAAIQVGIAERLLIIDIGDLDEDEEYIEGDAESERRLSERRTSSNIEVYINPQIIKAEGSIDYEEGCLSVPGVYSTVRRKEHLWLRYQDVEGKTHEIETTGLRSIVLQHEMDHLDGIVFTDRLGPMQRMMTLKKYEKLQAAKKREKQEVPG
jgi:peptide deformylase